MSFPDWSGHVFDKDGMAVLKVDGGYADSAVDARIPHTCGDPECPGNRTRLLLEAGEKMAVALRDIVERAEAGQMTEIRLAVKTTHHSTAEIMKWLRVKEIAASAVAAYDEEKADGGE